MSEDPLIVHARLQVGRVLRSKWTLERLIGVGSYGAVFQARHRNGSPVAIKLLHPTMGFDTRFAQRLIQEGYIANKIDHPAIVKVIDDDTDERDGTAFLVMEYLEGMTLTRMLERRRCLPASEVFTMLDPALEAVGLAHEKGIVHRDIKPDNLFLLHDGAIKVLDFGIARVAPAGGAQPTRSGSVEGSPSYMPPEQALGRLGSQGPQSDVYSIGATMFKLITGRTPHAGESVQEMIILVATQSARSITTVAPDLPSAVARIVDKALAYDRDKRYPDARAMLVDIRAVLTEFDAMQRALTAFSGARSVFREEDEATPGQSSALDRSSTLSAAPSRTLLTSHRLGELESSNIPAVGMLRGSVRLGVDADLDPSADAARIKRLAAALDSTQAMERTLQERFAQAIRGNPSTAQDWLRLLGAEKPAAKSHFAVDRFKKALTAGDRPSLGAMAAWLTPGSRLTPEALAATVQAALGVPPGLERDLCIAGQTRNVIAHRHEYEANGAMGFGIAAQTVVRLPADSKTPSSSWVLDVPADKLAWLHELAALILESKGGR